MITVEFAEVKTECSTSKDKIDLKRKVFRKPVTEIFSQAKNYHLYLDTYMKTFKEYSNHNFDRAFDPKSDICAYNSKTGNFQRTKN